MLRSRPVKSRLTKKELCKSVAKRVLKANQGMKRDDVKRITKRAVNHLKSIQELPRYSQVINMTHEELNLVLLECPESPYFARDDWETTE